MSPVSDEKEQQQRQCNNFIAQDLVIQLGDTLLIGILVPPLNNEDGRQKELGHCDRVTHKSSVKGGRLFWLRVGRDPVHHSGRVGSDCSPCVFV